MHLAIRKANEWRRAISVLTAVVAVFGAPLVSAPEASASTQGTVSGVVYTDANSDGAHDVAETGLLNRTVYVDLNSDGDLDGGEPTASTGTGGTYSISGVTAGSYPVRTVQPAGWITTTSVPNTTVVADTITSGVEIGSYQLGSIAGTVYNDINGNGLRSVATTEVGLVGRTVFIDANSNGTPDGGELTSVTDSGGAFSFTGLLAGAYVLRVVVPAGETQTSTSPATINVVSGSTFNNILFGLYLDSRITGTVFNDLNANMLQGTGENGLANITVFLDANDNGSLDFGEQSAVTDVTGAYALPNLKPQNHRVRIVVPSGHTRMTANPALVFPSSGGTSTGVSFGLFIQASIAGGVFDDTDGNGAKAVGESYVPGVTVYLDANGNALFDGGEPTTVTDSGGTYSFSGLNPGAYRARIFTPANSTQTNPTPAAVTPTSGSAATGIDFGLFYKSSISGSVFEDQNANGARDAGEPGLSGKSAFLDTNTNGVFNSGEPTAVTDGSGNYTFTGLGLGTYSPRVTVPSDSVLTTSVPGSLGTQSGSSSVASEMGLFLKATVSGVVYNDVAGDGVKDSGDTGVGSKTVFVDLNSNGVADTLEPKTTTNVSGGWSISNLGPGTYSVRMVVPTGAAQTTAALATVTPLSGSSTGGLDFGLFTYASITGSVFVDLYGDGVKNGSDGPAASRTVYLDANANDVLDGGEITTSTNVGGVFTFSGLSTGTYRVRLVAPSNALKTTGDPGPVSLTSAGTSSGISFGLYTFATIGGTIYNDLNSNTARTSDEPGRSGVTVYIDANSNDVLDLGEMTTTSSNTGEFSFPGLLPGSYRMRFVVPAGSIMTTPDPITFTPQSGFSWMSTLVGVYQTGSIAGTVFHDVDGNGARDGGEHGMPGVTVFFDLNNNNTLNAGEPVETTDGNGAYLFSNRGFASYRVRIVVPSGSLLTSTLPATISLYSGTNATGVDFGSFVGGSISGSVYTDSNGNGTRDAGEPGSNARTVFIDANNNGVKDSGERGFTTSSSGDYTFSGLAKGAYKLRLFTTSSYGLTSGLPGDIAIADGTVVNGVNFGVTGATSGGSVTTPGTGASSPAPTGPVPVPVDAISQNTGYYMTSADGGVFAYGDAKFFGSAAPFKPNAPIVAIAPTATGNGYYQVATDGGIFAFGDAKFYGSMGGKRLNKPIVGMASTPTGNGYWLVATDGGIFAYGDARFYGSTGSIKLNQPIVGMAATPSGQGYWLVATDGGIFAYGDARFYGSTGSIKLNQPIVGMAASANDGYWLVASDGGIFAFGSARFYGSMGGTKLNKPIVSIRAPLGGGGYWMFASDGGVFAFGNAKFKGGTPPTGSPIVNSVEPTRPELLAEETPVVVRPRPTY